MRAHNSFAVATAVSVISLVIMLTQPAEAGTISISSPEATTISVSRFLAHQDAIDDRTCDSRLTATDDSFVAPSVAFDSLQLSQQAMKDAGASLMLSDMTFVAPAAALIGSQDLFLSTGTLLDYACTLGSKGTPSKDSAGGEKSDASTSGVRHPTIHAAPEPGSLAYAAGAAAVCGVWQLRRRRRNPDRA